MIPQIENSIINETVNLITYPNLTYKYNDYQTAGKVDNLEAIEQAIKHILSVERYAYLIYDDNYGVELEQYIGQDLSYLEATIEDTLKDALLQDDRIENVQVTDISTSMEKLSLIDKTKFYNLLQTEDERDIVTEEDLDNIVERNTALLDVTSITEVQVVNVSFDVFCKQGVISTEVKINV